MHIHARIERWVIWWFDMGVVCGAIALANIFGRDLSRAQEKVMLLTGMAFWVLGGLACYACDGIRFDTPSQEPGHDEPSQIREQSEWHAASDFLLPGNRKSLLPPRR